MGKKTLITLGIVLVVLIASLLFVHAVPFWVTLSCLVTAILFGVGGFILGKKSFEKEKEGLQETVEILSKKIEIVESAAKKQKASKATKSK